MSVTKSHIESEHQPETDLDFIPLVYLSHGKLNIDVKGLQLIEKLASGAVHLVAVSGSPTILPDKIYNSKYTTESYNCGIFISTIPRYSETRNEHFFYLSIF